MAISWSVWDRVTLLVIVSILGVSTGLASSSIGSGEGITGHTSYVTSVRLVEPEADPDLATITYGLATYRDTRFFGLWSAEHPVPESQDRMVFVWSADAPDPRQAGPIPTGDFARVRDRLGTMWTVYEFTYLAAGALHHTYGVRVGATQDAADPHIGDHGEYNYVLVYRPTALLTARPTTGALPGAGPADELSAQAGATSAVGPAEQRRPPSLQETLDSIRALEEAAEPEEAPEAPRLAFGTGKTPQALQHEDPAPAPLAGRLPVGNDR